MHVRLSVYDLLSPQGIKKLRKSAKVTDQKILKIKPIFFLGRDLIIA